MEELPRSGLVRVSSDELDQVARELRLHGDVFRLPEAIRSKEAFFDAVRRTLPMDPPLVGSEKWDALADSLWGGLDALESTEIAIIWPDSGAMETYDPESFAVVQSVFVQVTESLADSDATAGSPKAVVVILG